MLLSIIIPTYNNARFLNRCIDSLSLPQLSAQVIVIDDGSTDDTQEVLAGIQKKNPCVKIITQQNSGVSSARNAGLQASSSEFVMFVDADDRLCPGALELLADDLGNVDSDVIVCNSFSNNKPFYPWQDCFISNQKYEGRDLMRVRYVRGSVCGCVFRTSFLRRNGLTFSQELSIGEDTVFFACTLSAGANVSFRNINLYDVILRPDSSSHKYDDSFFLRYGRVVPAARFLIDDRCIADNTLLNILMGVVHISAKLGYNAEQVRLITNVDSVLPLNPAVFTKQRWLVKVLNRSFTAFFMIKRWKDIVFCNQG